VFLAAWRDFGELLHAFDDAAQSSACALKDSAVFCLLYEI
jgi:hypothetical protein